MTIIRQFFFSWLFTFGSIIGVWYYLGFGAAITIAILIALEVVFSFDNAVINAKTLVKMSRIWQILFLTVGILIAVFGMRLVFPIAIVSFTANLGWQQVIDLALNNPERYAQFLEAAHYSIASFGGAFLLTLTLYFFFDRSREILWIRKLEQPLQKVRGGIWLPALIGLAVVAVIAAFSDHRSEVLPGGIAGVLTYSGIHLLIETLSRVTKKANAGAHYVGWGAFAAFIYLEILDASFSFDGVLGAFAITNSVPLIAIGLGVGALWVRSLTVYMVRNGTLQAFRYLEHGAHYAIFALAVALLYSIFNDVPEVITGTVGIAIIGASFVASKQFNAARARGELTGK